MSYTKRLDHAFQNAPVLPITPYTQYVFFSDCHRGIGNHNDNFLKNINNYLAALQYYYQYDFCYIEAGDGDELWENHNLHQIVEMHTDIFSQLIRFYQANRLYMLYGNHDIEKSLKSSLPEELPVYEGLIFQSAHSPLKLYVTHGHQADFFNSCLWRLARFLVRHLWAPLEYFGVHDPTSAAKNNTKKEKLEKRYLSYATQKRILLLTGHTHRPTLGNPSSPYYNCGSCVHPKCITCIELCGFQISLVKWCASSEKNGHFGNIYAQCPPTFPVYITRE
ncbi:MAG: serine/threonine protein phosphatase, partial [Lachnospiraceae bacterium]|nr:serine/threonine protein phosphatase [Lachnospiraceae bacterium]